eukprot:TRINITY_DN21828_c0_g1_i1.p1 TRINITY_DN21828_c0_g1~~TRINITY_DN21828_c0_g1_i1.p1  ORF type:complete len:465 (-),score=141.80 TRINITY_DN21828_c0_g1_i1:152-1546(-)
MLFDTPMQSTSSMRGASEVRVLRAGEAVELSGHAWLETVEATERYHGRALSDGLVGWFSALNQEAAKKVKAAALRSEVEKKEKELKEKRLKEAKEIRQKLEKQTSTDAEKGPVSSKTVTVRATAKAAPANKSSVPKAPGLQVPPPAAAADTATNALCNAEDIVKGVQTKWCVQAIRASKTLTSTEASPLQKRAALQKLDAIERDSPPDRKKMKLIVEVLEKKSKLGKDIDNNEELKKRREAMHKNAAKVDAAFKKVKKEAEEIRSKLSKLVDERMEELGCQLSAAIQRVMEALELTSTQVWQRAVGACKASSLDKKAFFAFVTSLADGRGELRKEVQDRVGDEDLQLMPRPQEAECDEFFGMLCVSDALSKGHFEKLLLQKAWVAQKDIVLQKDRELDSKVLARVQQGDTLQALQSEETAFSGKQAVRRLYCQHEGSSREGWVTIKATDGRQLVKPKFVFSAFQ